MTEIHSTESEDVKPVETHRTVFTHIFINYKHHRVSHVLPVVVLLIKFSVLETNRIKL